MITGNSSIISLRTDKLRVHDISKTISMSNRDGLSTDGPYIVQSGVSGTWTSVTLSRDNHMSSRYYPDKILDSS